MGGDWRLHVILAIHWYPTNVQRVLALVDMGAEYTLLHRNPEKFPGPEVSIDGYGGHSVRAKAVQLSLGIRCLPPTMSILLM